MKKFFRETAMILIALLPAAYLAFIWEQLPETVPVHFGVDGKADSWSHKSTLWAVPGAMTVGLYLLMLVIPALDPKKRLREMGAKYHYFRFILGAFFSALSLYILFVTQSGDDINPRMLVAILGGLFVALGNYMQAVKPNYFIGIRTPWTLENEEVWKSTHRLGGRLWMGGGLLLIAFSLLVTTSLWLMVLLIAVMLVITLVPLLHSYLLFRGIARLNGNRQE